MSEENIENIVQETETPVSDMASEAVVESVPEVSEAEQKARDMGWRPQDEFKGRPNIWVDADTYIKNRPLIENNKELKRVVGDMKRTIDHLVVHNKQIEEITYARAMDDLKLRQMKAAEVGDVASVNKYTDEIVKLKTTTMTAPVMEAPSALPEEVNDFARRHANWFNRENPQNAAMREYAINLDNQLMQSHPDMPLADRLKRVENDIQSEFPSRFNAVRRPGSVSPGAIKPTAGKVLGFEDLDTFHKNIVRRLQASRPNDKEIVKRYIQQLKQTGNIE